MSKHYILDGHNDIPVNLMTWARWFEKADRQVAASGKKGKLFVSTVFLGLDHSFGDGSPMLFETMIFGGEHDQFQERCSTWDQAEQMHKRACQLAGLNDD